MALLQKLAKRAIASQALANEDRDEFAGRLRQFLTTAYEQNEVFGSEGLSSLYPADLQADVRSSFNKLVKRFNRALERKSKPKTGNDGNEGGDGMEVDQSGPESDSDDSDEEGKAIPASSPAAPVEVPSAT
jgi:hypothetical protein